MPAHASFAFAVVFVLNVALWEVPHGGYVLAGLAAAALLGAAAAAWWWPVAAATLAARAAAEWRRRDDVLITRMTYTTESGEALAAPVEAEARVREQLDLQRAALTMADLEDAVGESMPHVLIEVRWPSGGATTLVIDFAAKTVNGAPRGITGTVFGGATPWRGEAAAAKT